NMNEDERRDQKPFSFAALSMAATDGGLTRSENVRRRNRNDDRSHLEKSLGRRHRRPGLRLGRRAARRRLGPELRLRLSARLRLWKQRLRPGDLLRPLRA